MIKEVFQELNLNIEDEIELDGLVGNKIKDDNISDCSMSSISIKIESEARIPAYSGYD